MNEVSKFRLYLMRATYLLMLAGLAITVWPGVVRHALSVPLAEGVVSSLLAAVAVLAAVGLRYPLRMLPLLLFELLWKSIWLLAFALPLWRAGQMDAGTRESVFACLMGIVILPIAIPWRHVFASYFAGAAVLSRRSQTSMLKARTCDSPEGKKKRTAAESPGTARLLHSYQTLSGAKLGRRDPSAALSVPRAGGVTMWIRGLPWLVQSGST